VLPPSDVKAPSVDGEPPIPSPTPRLITGARITGIVDDSQASRIGLRKDDLVVQYDGSRIEDSGQLVVATRQRSSETSVEMVLIRDGRPVIVRLNGGFIGIRVKTGVVENDGFESFIETP
jgi:S1-C subfamily serine protease